MHNNLIKISLLVFLLFFLILGTTQSRTLSDPNYYKNNTRDLKTAGAPAHGPES